MDSNRSVAAQFAASSGPARLQPPGPWHEPNGAVHAIPTVSRVPAREYRRTGQQRPWHRGSTRCDPRRGPARGWSDADVRWIEDAGYSGKDTRRPGIQIALDVLARGEAAGLVVAKMDRLSRSLLDFTQIMAEAQRQGWALVALDCPADPSTPTGEAMASILATFSQLERRLIGQRTREALAVKRAEGVRLGRPRALPDAVVARVVSERADGRSLRRIADDLNAAGVPTAQGGACWYASTVRAVLASAQREAESTRVRTA